MYKDDYEYKRYKEEYDAYEDEKQELIKELEKEEEKERSIDLREAMMKIKNKKKYDFLVVTHSVFIIASIMFLAFSFSSSSSSFINSCFSSS